jgi:hypothetical protein
MNHKKCNNDVYLLYFPYLRKVFIGSQDFN